jgi:hypothetical protein
MDVNERPLTLLPGRANGNITIVADDARPAFPTYGEIMRFRDGFLTPVALILPMLFTSGLQYKSVSMRSYQVRQLFLLKSSTLAIRQRASTSQCVLLYHTGMTPG